MPLTTDSREQASRGVRPPLQLLPVCAQTECQAGPLPPLGHLHLAGLDGDGGGSAEAQAQDGPRSPPITNLPPACLPGRIPRPLFPEVTASTALVSRATHLHPPLAPSGTVTCPGLALPPGPLGSL